MILNKNIDRIWLLFLLTREKAIEVERSRRKEAEERLKQYLVDPYQSPNVNSELRHRLPRANKSDPLLGRKDLESSEESGVDEPTVLKSRSSRSHGKRFVDFESCYCAGFRGQCTIIFIYLLYCIYIYIYIIYSLCV